MKRKWLKRLPGLKQSKFEAPDTYFSSGKQGKNEQKEWAEWRGDYKEKDYFKHYINEAKKIPNFEV